MHTKGRAQLTVGQMINVTHDELRIERRKTTELIVSCFRDLPKVPSVLRDIDAYLGLPTLRGAPLSLPAARAVLAAQVKDTLARKCRDGTGTWNASLPGCPAERPIQLYRTRDAAQYLVHAIDAIGSLRRHESVPLDTLLGGAAGRVRVDRALAGHPFLRALWGCFKPPRCAADGVLRPTRAACPAGVEL